MPRIFTYVEQEDTQPTLEIKIEQKRAFGDKDYWDWPKLLQTQKRGIVRRISGFIGDGEAHGKMRTQAK